MNLFCDFFFISTMKVIDCFNQKRCNQELNYETVHLFMGGLFSLFWTIGILPIQCIMYHSVEIAIVLNAFCFVEHRNKKNHARKPDDCRRKACLIIFSFFKIFSHLYLSNIWWSHFHCWCIINGKFCQNEIHVCMRN